jgi:cyclopropane-fatty-acyl-phospholipid synthase
MRRRNSPFGAVLISLFKRFLPPLDYGRLVVEFPSGERAEFCGPQPGPDALLIINNWRFLWRSMTGGEIGFAESYIANDCTTPDIATFLHLIVMNDRSFQVGGGVMLSRIVNRWRHFWRRNSRRGSRRNIAAHYDLGNAFYEKWLDADMQYSSAIYATGSESLETAQKAKLERIVSLLRPEKGDAVLEIGCGWGGLAEELLRNQCHVTGLTLSSEQLAYARARLNQTGLAERGDLRLQDYRDVQGTFDRIASVEMVEAVGEKYWPHYFAKLRDSLRPGGIGVIQAITIDEDRFDAYRSQPDFIQRYIFPGGMLPTVTALRAEIAKAGLSLIAVETFAESYAKTLQEWRIRFLQAWPSIESLGFDPHFKRMWEYYLAYCEAGFRAQTVNVGLYQFQRI